MTTLIISPGHGGLGPQSTYLTPGKRSPEVPPGIYEGEFNRAVAAAIEQEFYFDGDIDGVVNVSSGPLDTPLRSRIKYANALQKKIGGCTYIAVHANAKGRGKRWYDRARGTTVFYKAGDKKSKALALSISQKIEELTGIPSRGIRPGRWLRECRGPHMPAVLVECLFMTSRLDIGVLRDPNNNTERRIALGIYRGYKEISK
jgi:N-acetylmuramoyl-L-alanine amidase